MMKTIDQIRRENLELLVGELGTLDAVAEAGGTSSVYLSQVRNQAIDKKSGLPRKMGTVVARRLERGAGKSEGWMDQDHKAFANVKLPGEEKLRPYPVISSVQAGLLTEVSDPYPVGAGYDVIYASTEWSDLTFGLDVEGPSMMPTYPEGTRLVVDPLVRPHPGDLVIAKNTQEEATFKKYRLVEIDKNGNEVFELIPLNPDFPTLRSDVHHLRIVGTVVEVRYKLRHHRKT